MNHGEKHDGKKAKYWSNHETLVFYNEKLVFDQEKLIFDLKKLVFYNEKWRFEQLKLE
jgi:hypothetical protein